MIMMGLRFMGDVPFRDVYIHALVRDEEGQKMSKSRGNVIDPLDIMSKYGTDAFRFTLAAMAAMGRDIKLAEDRIAGYQNFVNKLWNAARFVQMNLAVSSDLSRDGRCRLAAGDLGLVDRWIRSRLAGTVCEAREALAAYRFNDYASALYRFTWHEFCDWYIEMSKLALNGTVGDDPEETRRILRELLEQILLLLHPIMPFVTEEIWQGLGSERASIMIQKFPAPEPQWIDAAGEKQIEFLMAAVRAVRNLRTELNCPPGKRVKVVLYGQLADLDFCREYEAYLRALARVGAVDYLSSGDRPKGAATAVVGAMEIYLPLDDLTHLIEERRGCSRKWAKSKTNLTMCKGNLGTANFSPRRNPR
jgi:valyl-tRNA synthetase